MGMMPAMAPLRLRLCPSVFICGSDLPGPEDPPILAGGKGRQRPAMRTIVSPL